MRDNFKRHLLQLRKERREFNYDGLMEEIRKSFFHHLAFLPEEMLFDMFNYFLDSYTDAEDLYRDFDMLSEKLLDITDIFNSNYDETGGTITDDDFDYLKDTVNDFSKELPEEVLFYVMKLAVDRGRFRG